VPGTTALSLARTDSLLKVEAVFPRLSADRLTSAAGNSSGTTAYINKLGNYPDDFFEDSHWLILPDGPLSSAAGSLEARLVTEFDSNDGTGNTLLTTREPFSAQVASGITAYVSPIHPETLRQALNGGSQAVYPQLFAYRQMHHIGGSRAWNGMWEYWDADTLPLWWSKSDSLMTVAKLTEPYYGQWGVTITADGAGARYLKSTPDNPALLNQLATHNVVFHAMIRSSVASEIGVSISDGAGDGATVFHDGDGTWQEVVTAARTMAVGRPSAPIEFRIHAIASAVGQIGPVWTTGGPAQRRIPLVPGRFKRGPTTVKQMNDTWPTFVEIDSENHDWHMESRSPQVNAAGAVSVGNDIVFNGVDLPGNERLMVFEGIDYLTEAASESDVYEIEGDHADVMYDLALGEVARGLANQPGGGATSLHMLFASDWEAIAARKLNAPGFRMARPRANFRPTLASAGATGRSVI
jgi:hypothetical protein